MPWLKACLPGINIILVSLHKTSLRLWQLDPKQEVPGHWLCDAVHPVCFISKSDSWNNLQASHIKRVGLHSSISSSHWNPCFPSCILHSTFENLILGQYLNPCKTILLNYFWRYIHSRPVLWHVCFLHYVQHPTEAGFLRVENRKATRQVLNISGEGDSAVCLGSLFQCSVTLKVKSSVRFMWNFLGSSFCVLPLVLLLAPAENSLSSPTWLLLSACLQALIRSLCLLFSWLNSLFPCMEDIPDSSSSF